MDHPSAHVKHMPEQEALIKLLRVTATDKLTDEVSQESLWMEMMMFADDTAVSIDNRKQVGKHSGVCPESAATFKPRPKEGGAQI